MSCSTGSMTARASSGSSSRINSVEPLMSANNAVTVLRSPSTVVEALACLMVVATSGTCPEGACDRGVAANSAAPQSPQKGLPGGLSAPHWVQRLASSAPQSPQNFLPTGFWLPQFEQRILPHSGCDVFVRVRLCRLLSL